MASGSEAAGTSHVIEAATSGINSVVGSSNVGDWVSKYVDPSLLLNEDVVGVVANTVAVQLGLEFKGTYRYYLHLWHNRNFKKL